MLNAEKLVPIQAALAKAGVDGWLIFDFHGLNPVALGMLELHGMATRRIFVFIPASGDPVALTHAIEQGPWRDWPANWVKFTYSGWRELESHLASMVNGKTVSKEVNSFMKIKLGEKPKLVVAIEPYVEGETNFVERAVSEKPLEITIAPGQIIPVWLKVKRSGHDDLVTFTVDNLPHGMIVDNIGLSGVLIPKGESERQIFLKAAKWVPETDRLAHLQAKQAGNPTSLPVLIHVRRPSSEPKISALK